MDLSDLSENPNFSSTYSISGCRHDSGQIVLYTISGYSDMLRLAEAFGILGVKSWDLSINPCVPHFPLLVHLRGSILWAKPNFLIITQLLVIDHLFLIWCTWLYDWMELYDHLVSGCLFILCLTIPALSGLFYYIIALFNISLFIFSINLNGVTLIPFNYCIYMEFFLPFLSKFFSSYSWGMEGLIFCRALGFDFWIS